MTIKNLRYKKGMTQQQLAMALGVSRQTVASLEKEGFWNYCSPLLVKKACDFFSVSALDVVPLGEALRYKPANKDEAKRLIKMIKEAYL